jgi:hypothetical protein
LLEGMTGTPAAYADLYWLPVGAGGHFVRWNARCYERLVAFRDHRMRADLYHSALILQLEGTTYTVEMGPVWNVPGDDHGSMCVGPVGARWLGRFRAFRYEVRCWPGGRVPDIDEAVASPVRVADDPAVVAAILGRLRQVPVLTWGRDELGAGEMWNSNSVVSWTLARAGVDATTIAPPANGRAPGWGTGVELALQQAGRGARTDRRAVRSAVPSR